MSLALDASTDSNGLTESEDESELEVVIVTGARIADQFDVSVSRVAPTGLDNSDLLRVFPGANRNANGPVTRISQYRGLFGAHNNVVIDGQAYTSGGPNWMDSPLSSIPQSLTRSVTLYRGLGSVTVNEEGLGGGLSIEPRKGDFSDLEQWATYGQAQSVYGDNASSWGLSLFTGVHNRNHRIDFAASLDRGDDYGFNGGTVAATEFDRKQYRFGYGHRFDSSTLEVSAVINRTGVSGTPALPMDIIYFDSEQYGVGFKTRLASGDLEFRVNTLSVEHVMDNFSLRPPPEGMGGMKMTRETLAVGDSDGFKMIYDRQLGAHHWWFGIDGKQETHDADISDPMRSMFYITNFNDVERDRLGAFAETTVSAGRWNFEAGFRYNRVWMDAGEVGGNLGVPGMQQNRLDALAAAFNAAERSKTDGQLSGQIKASRQLGDEVRLNLGLGRKVRSPSYQERYLWLPMEATAGLADGYTYIGDINLKPETSIELTAGIDWSAGIMKFTPEVFYRDVDNYIQGVPSTNMTANMFAMMASGRLPLQFANVDAEFYGLDMGYEVAFTGSLLLRGNLSYVRGKRTDIKDNLYRIAPLSSFVELVYRTDTYFIGIESLAASSQEKVSAYNDEQTTAGWGIASLKGGFNLGQHFALSLGVENIFDKAYQDHLGGYNRVAGSDVPLRERLYSRGRNYYIKLDATW